MAIARPASSKSPSPSTSTHHNAAASSSTISSAASSDSLESERAFLDTVEGEIAFFRATMRARPIGINKFFHIISIRNLIFKQTGRKLHIETLWEKARSCWDLDALDAIDLEAESYIHPNNASASSTPIAIHSPSPSENLSRHPFFREEYSLPHEEPYITLMAERRMRATASTASSPAPSSPPSPPPPPTAASSTGGPKKVARYGRKRKSKLDLAGLVAGDSDSSDLTQESGDEGGGEGEGGVDGNERARSAGTGTDNGTDYMGEEDVDVEMHDSPAAHTTSEKPRARGRTGTRRGRARGAGGARSTTTRKRKR